MHFYGFSSDALLYVLAWTGNVDVKTQDLLSLLFPKIKAYKLKLIRKLKIYWYWFDRHK